VSTISAPEAPPSARHLETELFSTRPTRSRRGGDAPRLERVDDLRNDSRSRLARVSARAAYQEVLFGRAVLVDIRPQRQREQEGEVHPDLGPVVIERNVLQWRLDPRRPSSLPIADLGLRVILICQDGHSSSLAAEVLLRLGIHRSADIIGGFAAWRSAGLPRRRWPSSQSGRAGGSGLCKDRDHESSGEAHRRSRTRANGASRAGGRLR
jgi:rhodanese-related sulfurtransferase